MENLDVVFLAHPGGKVKAASKTGRKGFCNVG
jgi:hypothetical protein